MVTITKGDNHKVYAGGVETAIEDSQFPQRLLESANSIEAGNRATVYIDDRQLNSTSALYQKLKECDCQEGLDTLLFWINGRPAIGGFQLIRSIMAHTGIMIAEACGVKLSKDSQKFIREQWEAKRLASRGSGDDNDQP